MEEDGAPGSGSHCCVHVRHQMRDLEVRSPVSVAKATFQLGLGNTISGSSLVGGPPKDKAELQNHRLLCLFPLGLPLGEIEKVSRATLHKPHG